MAADTLGKNAQWWVDQAANLKAELDAVNPQLDAAKQQIINLQEQLEAAQRTSSDQLAAAKSERDSTVAGLEGELSQAKACIDMVQSLDRSAMQFAAVAASIHNLTDKIKG